MSEEGRHFSAEPEDHEQAGSHDVKKYLYVFLALCVLTSSLVLHVFAACGPSKIRRPWAGSS